MSSPAQECRFGDITIDFTGRRLWRAGEEQALEPKAFAVLALLVGEPGRVFTRDEILDAVWGHRHVTPGVLNRIVTLLRRHTSEFRLSLALTLVLGGALGNVIDRIRFGAVVDFVQWHVAGFYWPAFNVADSAITIGAVLLIWDQFATKPATDRSV